MVTSPSKISPGRVRESCWAEGPEKKRLFQKVQKRHRVDQIISKLRRADVGLGKGKLHDKVLNQELFLRMQKARWVIDR